MANQYDSPILGGIKLDTQPYYNALAKSNIAKSGLENSITNNPFNVEGIDADRANLQGALDPYNTELTDLVETPGLLDNPREFSKRLMGIRNKFKQGQEGGDLSPYMQRKRGYDQTMVGFDQAIKVSKSTQERAFITAQKEKFANSQTAFDGTNSELTYNTGLNGERADIYQHVDPLGLAISIGKEVKANGITLEPSTEELENNSYYQIGNINGKASFVSKDKLFSAIVPGFKAKINELYRAGQIDGNRNMGIDEKGEFIGHGEQYAINLDKGPEGININTELGAAIASATGTYEYDVETNPGQIIKSPAAFEEEATRARAAAKKKAEEDAPELGAPNQVYETGTTDTSVFEEKHNYYQKDLTAFDKKLANGEKLSGDEVKQYVEAKEAVAFYKDKQKVLDKETMPSGETYGAYKAKINAKRDKTIKAELLNATNNLDSESQEAIVGSLLTKIENGDKIYQSDISLAIGSNKLENLFNEILNDKGSLAGGTSLGSNQDWYDETGKAWGLYQSAQNNDMYIAPMISESMAGNVRTVPDGNSSERIDLTPKQKATYKKNGSKSDMDAIATSKAISKSVEEFQIANKIYTDKLDDRFAAGVITQVINIDPNVQNEAYKAVKNDIEDSFTGTNLGQIRTLYDIESSPIKKSVNGEKSTEINIGGDEKDQQDFKKEISGGNTKLLGFSTSGKEQYMRVQVIKGTEGDKVTTAYDIPLSKEGIKKYGTMLADADPRYAKKSYIAGGIQQQEEFELGELIQKAIPTKYSKSSDLRKVFRPGGKYAYNEVLGDVEITMRDESFGNTGSYQDGTVIEYENGQSFTFNDYISVLSKASPNLKIADYAPLQAQINRFISTMPSFENEVSMQKLDNIRNAQTLGDLQNLIKDSKVPMYFNNQLDASKFLTHPELAPKKKVIKEEVKVEKVIEKETVKKEIIKESVKQASVKYEPLELEQFSKTLNDLMNNESTPVKKKPNNKNTKSDIKTTAIPEKQITEIINSPVDFQMEAFSPFLKNLIKGEDPKVKPGEFNDETLSTFITAYKDFEYGSKAGSKGENGEIDCSGLVCKFIETKGKGDNYKQDRSSQGLWLQSNNQQSYKSKDDFINELDSISNETIIAFSTGDSLSDNRKYGIDHVGLVIEDSLGNKFILESASGKKGFSVMPLEKRIKELKLSNRKGKGVIFTGQI
jgi:hypothetical protein